MFLKSNYVLGSELCEYLGIAMANLSIFRREREHEEDFRTVQKYGNTIVIDLDSHSGKSRFPISPEERKSANFTDLTNSLPIPFLWEEHELRLSDLKIIGGKEIKACRSRLWVFSDEFVQRITPKNKSSSVVLYILNDTETKECLQKGLIRDFIPLTKETPSKESRNLVWYYVGGVRGRCESEYEIGN